MPGSSKNRFLRILFWAFKFSITGLVCVWLFRNIEWQEFWGTVRSLPPTSLLVLMGLAVAGVMISVWKWQILLQMHGVHYRYINLAKWYFTGMFISVFLPTNIGGDAYRIYRTYRNPRSRVTSVLSVFIERVSGLAALLIMGYLAAIASWYDSGNELSYIVAIAGTLSILIGIVFLFMVVKFRLIVKLSKWKKIPGFIDSLLAHGTDYQTQPLMSLYVMLLSFIFHIVRVCGLVFLLSLLKADVSIYEVIVVSSLTTLLGMLPVSIGGFGVIEGSFTYLMSIYGLPMNIGLSTILVFRISGILLSLVGVLFYLLEKESPAKQLSNLSAKESSEICTGK